MRKHIKPFQMISNLVLVFLLGLQSATAASLSFIPSAQTIGLNEQAEVDVVFQAPSGALVSAYDFFVNYDPSVVAFAPSVNLSFGPSLGSPLDSNWVLAGLQPGQVNVGELSLVSDLTTLQDGVSDLLLFSMVFQPVDIGVSVLSFSGGIGPSFDFLADESGVPIVLDNVGAATITVVPIPAAVWLFGSALLGFVGYARAFGRKSRCSNDS